MSESILNNALKSASLNVVFQILLRSATFLLNAFVLRYITHDVVGVMNVRLLLLESTVLFLSREAFRKAALSQTESHSWQQIINLLWLTVPLSLFISIAFGFVWLYILNVPSPDITPHYSIGVWSISVSCVIEMFAEPLYIISQVFSFIKLRIVLDTSVVVIRTAIFIPWIILNPSNAVIAFSLAQIIANSVYSVGFYYFYYCYIKNSAIKPKLSVMHTLIDNKSIGFNKLLEKHGVEENKKVYEKVNETNDEGTTINKDFSNPQKFATPDLRNPRASLVKFNGPFPFTSFLDFFPRALNNQTWIHPNSAYLTWSFLKQGVLKQILTEGERYVMTLFSVMTFKEQGIYDVVNNLGSLVVRFLFRPVEDSLYFYFTQSIRRDAKLEDQNQETMKEASTVLHQSLNCFVDVGLVIFTFGQSYSNLLLYLYGGESIASGQGPTLLRAHSFSVLLLGINGITECYTFSTMSAHQLNRYNYLMAGFSILFLLVSWGLTKLFGGIGFIMANCSNMLARILHNILFIKNKYAETQFQPLYGLLPTKYFFSSLCIALLITQVTKVYCNTLQHFFVGMICFFIVIGVWAFERQELFHLAIRNLKKIKKA